MSRRLLGFGRVPGIAALMVAILLALPAVSGAGSLGFRNDLNGPVIVRGVAVVNNRPVGFGTIHLLYSGEVSLEGLLQPCTKVILIFDGNNRLLYREVKNLADDQFFSIRLDNMGNVTLVPTKFPKRKAQRSSP
jgi:hypothetical protein